jgi:hypothetical protein
LKLVSKVGVFALALILSAVPTMACMLPTVTLTAAERECCKKMANECGRAGMPSSHSCCQRLTGAETATFIKAPGAQLDHLASISYVSPAISFLLQTDLTVVHESLDFGVNRPPGSPPATISVLRI